MIVELDESPIDPPGRTTPDATVRSVVAALGSSLLNVLAAPNGLDVPVTVPVIFDPEDDLAEESGAVLLLVGMSADRLGAIDELSRFSAASCSAVVLKLRRHEPGPIIDAASRSGITVLAAADDVAWRRLDALITAAIAFGGRSASPDDAASDLFTVANAVAGVLGGAVAIEDAARNVVAYSTLSGQRIDDVRRDGILARKIPDLAKHDQQYREVYAAERAVHYPSDPATGELPRAAISIRAGNEVVGSIWVIEDHPPPTEETDAVLADASETAALHLIRTRAAADLERQARAEMLRGLFERRVPVSAAARTLGIRAGEHVAILAFSSPSAAGSGTSLAPRVGREVLHYVSAFRGRAASVVLHRTVYVLLPGVRGEDAAIRLAREAAAHAESAIKRPVHAAVATVTTDVSLAPKMREEADEILRVLSAEGRPTSAATARETYNRRLLGRLAEAAELDPETTHPGVEALLDHDRQRRTRYATTLLAYLNAGLDVAVAAAAVGIHPNTLRYRLRRAEELFGLDLDDADERLLVWIQLRLTSVAWTNDGRHPTTSRP